MSQEKLKSATNVFFIALGIDMAVTALVGVTDFWAVGVLNDIRSGVAKVDQSTISTLEFWESFAKVMILTLIGVGLALVRWLDACYEYAKETIKAKGFAQEGWKAWGWIVPFMNVFKPYQVLSEIYKAGAADYLGGEDWKKSSGSGMLLVWWAFWVIAHMVMWGIGKQALKSSFRDDQTLNQTIGMYYGSVTVCVISLIVAGLWFVVAGSLTRRLLNRAIPVVGSVEPVAGDTDLALYKLAADELNSNSDVRNEGLWYKAFADASGDEQATKAAYIRLRVEQLRCRADVATALASSSSADLTPSNTQATQAAARSSTPINFWVLGISVFLVIGIVAAIIISADEDMKKKLKVVQPSNPVPSAPKWEDLSDTPPPRKPTSKPNYNSEGWTQESTGSTEVGPWLKYSPPGTRYCRYADRTIYRVYPPGVMPNAERANPFCLGDSTDSTEYVLY